MYKRRKGRMDWMCERKKGGGWIGCIRGGRGGGLDV